MTAQISAYGRLVADPQSRTTSNDNKFSGECYTMKMQFHIVLYAIWAAINEALYNSTNAPPRALFTP
jgi:hypothetical protein